MEDDQAGARELVDAEAMLEGLRREAECVQEMSLSWAT